MNTFWIGGYPIKTDIARIKLFQDSLNLEDGIIPSNGYHMTLRYWEGHANLKDDVAAWLNDNSTLFGPLRASIHKLERFGKDKDVLVARFKSKALQDVFQTIEDGLTEIGVPKSDYSTYKPHLTLAEGIKRVPTCNLDILKTITFGSWEMTDENGNVLWSQGDVVKSSSWILKNCKFAK